MSSQRLYDARMRWWPLLLLVGCGGPRVVPTNPTDPATLIETGLCTDGPCERFADDAIELEPRYTLYADSATKRRWLALPEGERIDTSDMDDWRFPVGTRLWKEFTRDGVRVETRYIVKLLADDAAPNSWLFASFAWNAAQDETTRVPDAGVEDANGTQHDIPSRSACQGCHENLPGRVLGVGAMSLDGATPVSLADLVAMDMLTDAPRSAARRTREQARGLDTMVDADRVAHRELGTALDTDRALGPIPAEGELAFPVPGTDVDRAAFGYLHANCGHCHNPTSRVHLETPLELRLVTTARELVDVPARATTVDVAAVVGGVPGPIVRPGDPAGSVMIFRMNATEVPTKMPALGTEMIDPVGQVVLTDWILRPP